jgi:hypothetical protein
LTLTSKQIAIKAITLFLASVSIVIAMACSISCLLISIDALHSDKLDCLTKISFRKAKANTDKLIKELEGKYV